MRFERSLYAAGSRWWGLFRRRRVEQEVDEELRYHFDRLVETYTARGYTAEEAGRAALRDMGGLQQVTESCREVRRLGWIEDLIHDLRVAVRQLHRSPGFTAVAIVTLSIGIGANTAIFSVVNGVLLKPLPYAAPEGLVGVWHAAPGLNLTDLALCPSLYFTYREQGRVFQDIGLWDGSTATVTGLAEPEQVETLLVTDGTLSLLGMSTVLGRRFTGKDVSEGSPDTVILTYDYWQRRLGGDASVLGRRLMVNARPREVIGVLPPTFHFLNQKPALLLPLKFARTQLILGLFNYQAVARLKPGVTIQQADADVARMLPIWMRSFPAAPGYNPKLFDEARITPKLRPFKQDAVGDVGNVLWTVMGTIGVVLLIACANVANLLLARAEGRRQELAVRVVLGAGRTRIARELLIESLVLGVAGGVVGLAMASGALRFLTWISPVQLPRLEEINVDSMVLLFALAISLVSGVLFGLIPVFKYAAPQLSSALQAGGRTQTQGPERHRVRSGLVVIQVALALVLLISAGLMVRTFQALKKVQPGFTSPGEVQTLRIFVPEGQVRDSEQVVRMQHAVLERIAGIPGVVSSSLAQSVPMDGRADFDPIVTEDRTDAGRLMTIIRAYNYVAPGFFHTVGTPLIAGRDLTWTEIYDRLPVALVSENLARELWGEPAAAVGKRIRENLKSPWREVIGVVGDVRDGGIDKKAPTMVYWPIALSDFYGQDIMVKRSVAFAIRSTRTGTEGFMEEIRQAVWAVNKDLPLADVRTLGEIYDRSMARTSFALVMLAIAGGMALLLGIVGIYAVISSSVMQRTREIGIRIALGSRRSEVIALVLRQSVALTVVGIVLGLAGAAAVTRVLDGILFGVSSLDPATFLLVSLLLGCIATVAAHIPARRAARLAPMIALRQK